MQSTFYLIGERKVSISTGTTCKPSLLVNSFVDFFVVEDSQRKIRVGNRKCSKRYSLCNSRAGQLFCLFNRNAVIGHEISFVKWTKLLEEIRDLYLWFNLSFFHSSRFICWSIRSMTF